MKTNIPKSEGKKNHTLFFPVHTSTNMTYRHKEDSTKARLPVVFDVYQECCTKVYSPTTRIHTYICVTCFTTYNALELGCDPLLPSGHPLEYP